MQLRDIIVIFGHGIVTLRKRPTMDLSGNIIDGKYELLRLLASGGMGSVYEARQLAFQRTVSLKLLIPDVSSNDKLRQRFEREAALLAKLDSAHVVKFLSWGICDGNRPYLVMELLKGTTVSKAHENQPLDWRQAFSIGIDTCKGLEELHSLGVVHRDLTPSNLFLCEDGLVKIIDLGLATRLNNMQQLTETGALLGTVPYMSPEVCLGTPATNQSDVYSLGCILYQLITARLPVVGETLLELIHKQANQYPPSPQQLRSELHLPADVRDIVYKAIQKEHANRYANARELRIDLERALRAEKPQTRLQPWIPADAPERHNNARLMQLTATMILCALIGCTLLAANRAPKKHKGSESSASILSLGQKSQDFDPKTRDIVEFVYFSLRKGIPAATVEQYLCQWMNLRDASHTPARFLSLSQCYLELANAYHGPSKNTIDDNANLERTLKLARQYATDFTPDSPVQTKQRERQLYLTDLFEALSGPLESTSVTEFQNLMNVKNEWVSPSNKSVLKNRMLQKALLCKDWDISLKLTRNILDTESSDGSRFAAVRWCAEKLLPGSQHDKITALVRSLIAREKGATYEIWTRPAIEQWGAKINVSQLVQILALNHEVSLAKETTGLYTRVFEESDPVLNECLHLYEEKFSAANVQRCRRIVQENDTPELHAIPTRNAAVKLAIWYPQNNVPTSLQKHDTYFVEANKIFETALVNSQKLPNDERAYRRYGVAAFYWFRTLDVPLQKRLASLNELELAKSIHEHHELVAYLDHVYYTLQSQQYANRQEVEAWEDNFTPRATATIPKTQ